MRSRARGIYYLLEPMLIMLMVLAVFAVPLIQNDRLENSRLFELQANDVMSVLFQTGIVDRMDKACWDKNIKFSDVKDSFREEISAIVQEVSPVYKWHVVIHDGVKACEVGVRIDKWSSNVNVERTVIFSTSKPESIKNGAIILSLLVPPI